MQTPFDALAATPVQWISVPSPTSPPLVAAYRLRLQLTKPLTTRLYVSADQRYILYIDGQRRGRGPERGDKLHWFYETFDLSLPAGDHTLVAQVWSLALETMQAPKAQTSVQHGFVLTADEPSRSLFATGIAPWECKRLNGHAFVSPRAQGLAYGYLGGRLELRGEEYAWDFETGAGSDWQPAERRAAARDSLKGRFWGEFDSCILQPGQLPQMLDRELTAHRTLRHLDAPEAKDTHTIRIDPADHLEDEAANWSAFLAGTAELTIPAHVQRRAIIDLEQYVCAYPEITFSEGSGSFIRIAWSEGLLENILTDGQKGNRDEIVGKIFAGFGDSVHADGGAARTFRTLWWGCGRYVEILVCTGDHALTLERLNLFETRYPLEREGQLALSEPRFAPAADIMWRTLQMCAHETYMDCPYYEQLQYGGDTRLQILATYVSTRDDRLPRKAISIMQASQLSNGLLQSRYPANGGQLIPQFPLFWAGMVYDFALWRGDKTFVKSMMPGVRGVMEAFIQHIGDDGLLRTPDGWDFVDWVTEWTQFSGGQSTLDATGLSGINHLLFIYIAGLVAELETWVGEPALAARLNAIRQQLLDRTRATFWEPSRRLFADTPSRDSFSEHAQALACLTGLLDESEREAILHGLLHDHDLARTTIYFQHYLFEAFHTLGRSDAILDRLPFWYDLTKLGLKTTIEKPEPSRSDCHAWGAHPLYHAFASLLGIRPAGLGSDRFTVTPAPAGLAQIEGVLPHPAGDFTVRVIQRGEHYDVQVNAPKQLEVVVSHARLKPTSA